MEKYKIIFPFEALEYIKRGKEVSVLDRENCCVYSVNDLCVSEFADIIKEKDTEGRYEFWIAEEEEEKNGNAV